MKSEKWLNSLASMCFRALGKILELIVTFLYRELLKRNTLKPMTEIIQEHDRPELQRRLLRQWAGTKTRESSYIQLAVGALGRSVVWLTRLAEHTYRVDSFSQVWHHACSGLARRTAIGPLLRLSMRACSSRLSPLSWAPSSCSCFPTRGHTTWTKILNILLPCTRRRDVTGS